MRGALIMLNTAVLVPNNYYTSAYTYAEYQSVIHDSDGFFDPAHPDRLTIPEELDGWWFWVKTSGRWNPGGHFDVQIIPTYFSKNQNTNFLSGYPECDPDNRPAITGTTTDHGSDIHPKQCFAGDYFKTALWQQGPDGNAPARQFMAGSFSITAIAPPSP